MRRVARDRRANPPSYRARRLSCSTDLRNPPRNAFQTANPVAAATLSQTVADRVADSVPGDRTAAEDSRPDQSRHAPRIDRGRRSARSPTVTPETWRHRSESTGTAPTQTERSSIRECLGRAASGVLVMNSRPAAGCNVRIPRALQMPRGQQSFFVDSHAGCVIILTILHCSESD